MTESQDQASAAALSAMKLAQLQAIAAQLGLKGTSRLRKSELIETIKSNQTSRGSAAGSESAAGPRSAPKTAKAGTAKAGTARAEATKAEKPKTEATTPKSSPTRNDPATKSEPDALIELPAREDRAGRAASTRPQGSRRASASAGAPRTAEPRAAETSPEDHGGNLDVFAEFGAAKTQPTQAKAPARQRADRPARTNGREQAREQATRDQATREHPSRDRSRDHSEQGARAGEGDHHVAALSDIQLPDSDGPDDTSREGRRRRDRNRNRDRDRKRRPASAAAPAYDEVEVLDSDVLVPVAGVLDVLDNYAFVRTTGYLPGTSDVYVNLGMVRRYGLRRGDAVTGTVRQPRDGESASRQKFNALVAPELINNAPKDESETRPEFDSLTPIYPEAILELGEEKLTNKLVDVLAPIGMGQRTLVYAEPGSGRTRFLADLAQGITTANPDAHLMMVLVDERPEEVTHLERTISGEVIASTFDRPAVDHTTVAGLAVERAKRLVELGQDVVVILDSLTALTRAHHVSAPPTGRVLSHGVDAGALHATKQLFGAARKIENGGSLTIIATVLTGTGSKIDALVLEELRSTATSQITLSGELAAEGLFPAVDAAGTSNRHLETLYEIDDLAPRLVLRKLIAAKTPAQAHKWLTDGLKTASAESFLSGSVKVTPAERAAIRKALA